MSKEFETIVMSTYAELCVLWRMEVVSCRSNAETLNGQLSSLEEVIQAFGIGVPRTALHEPKPKVEKRPVQRKKVDPPKARPQKKRSDVDVLQPRPQRKSEKARVRAAEPELAGV